LCPEEQHLILAMEKLNWLPSVNLDEGLTWTMADSREMVNR
jgi:hypothetical protein